jgi:hypothetical protein
MKTSSQAAFQSLAPRVQNHGSGLSATVPAISEGYGSIDLSYQEQIAGQMPEWKLTVDAPNWAMSEIRTRFANASTTAKRAGLCFWIIVKLRNCVMHSNEEQLSLRNSKAELSDATAWVLAGIRLSQHGAEDTLNSLQEDYFGMSFLKFSECGLKSCGPARR